MQVMGCFLTMNLREGGETFVTQKISRAATREFIYLADAAEGILPVPRKSLDFGRKLIS